VASIRPHWRSGASVALVALVVTVYCVTIDAGAASRITLERWANKHSAAVTRLANDGFRVISTQSVSKCTVLAKELKTAKKLPAPPKYGRTWSTIISSLGALAKTCAHAGGTVHQIAANATSAKESLTDFAEDLALKTIPLGSRLDNLFLAWESTTTTTAPTAANTTPTTTAPPGPQVLFTQSGTGTQTTTRFTAPSTWTLAWSYTCSSFGTSGNFTVTVKLKGATFDTDAPVNQLGPSGSGTQHYHKGGSLYLSISSECSWKVMATSR
jgi:hypothetical protein